MTPQDLHLHLHVHKDPESVPVGDTVTMESLESVPDAGVAPLEPVGVVGRSASGKVELRGVKYEKEEAAKVGSSDGVGAAGTLDNFRSLIVERSVTVSSWRTLTLSSSFVIPLFLLLRLDSRDMTLEE